MGQVASIKGSAKPHVLLHSLTALNRADLQAIYDKYSLNLGQPFALNVPQMKVLFGGEGGATRNIFDEVFDTDHNGLVDARELFGSIAMLSKASVAEKIDFIHQLYDLSGVGELSRDELVIMFRSVASGCHKMDGNIPSIEQTQYEEFVDEMFKHAELESWQDMPKSKFDAFCSVSPVIDAFSEYWRQASSQVRLQKGAKWVDADGPSLFMPATIPLSYNSLMPPEDTYIRWCRATELFQEKICDSEPKLFTHAPLNLNHCARVAIGAGALGSGTFVEGNLADRWLLNALAIVATRPAMVENLFCHTGQESLGRFSLQLWDGRAWEIIFVDDRVPCDPARQVAFSRSSHAGEYWVPLVEKAFAKRAGSYAALLANCTERFEAGEDSIVTALRVLSGGHVEKLTMFEPRDTTACATLLAKALKWGVVGVLRRVRPGQLAREDGIGAGYAYGVVAMTEVPETGKTLIKLRDAFGHRPRPSATISDAHDLHAARMADLQLEQDLELLDAQLRRDFAREHRHFCERHFWMELSTFMRAVDVIYVASCPSMLQHCRDRTTTAMKKLAGARIARRPLPFAHTVKQTQFMPFTSMLSLKAVHAWPALLLETRQSAAMDPIWISVSQARSALHFDETPFAKGLVIVSHNWGSPQDAPRITELKNADIVFATFALQRAFTVTHQVVLSSGQYAVLMLSDEPEERAAATTETACVSLAGIGDSIICLAGNEIHWQPIDATLNEEDLAFAFGELHVVGAGCGGARELLRTQECNQEPENYMSLALSRRIHELQQTANQLHVDVAQAKGVL